MITKRGAVIILVMVSLVSALMVIGARQLKTTVEFEEFLPKDYPSIKALDEIKGRFPQSSTIFFVVSGENLATPEGVKILRTLENSLLSDPNLGMLILRVQSFADYIVSLDRPIPPEPVLKDLIDNILSNDNLRKEIIGRSLSEDYRSALVTVSIYPVNTRERGRIIQLFQRCVENLKTENFGISMTGDIVMYSDMNKLMNRDNRILIPVAGIFVLCVLLVALRKLSDVLISISLVGIASLWTIGLMGFLGISFTTLHVALIPLLLGLGVDYAIYFMKRYHEEREKSNAVEASNITVKTTGKAILVAAVTTIIGFASFGVSWLVPIRNLGYFAALGIGCAFGLALSFVPAVVILRDAGKKHEKKIEVKRKFGRRLAKICLTTAHKWKLVLIIVMLISIPSALSALSLKTSMSFETFLPSDIESVRTFEMIENNFGGQTAIWVIARGQTTTSESLQEMLIFENAVLSDPKNTGLITHSWSIANLLLIMSGGTLPNDDALIVQMLKSIDRTKKIPVLSEDNVALIYFFVNTRSEDEMRKATEIVRKHVENYQGNLNLRINGAPAVTGFPVILSDIMGSLWGSMMRSTLLTIILCFITLVVLFRSPLLGIGAMLPLLLALSWEFGTMRLAGWSLDVLTIGISALVIGLGIDYAVHITHRYLEERSRNPDKALVESLPKSLPPVLMGFATTAGVFAILSLSRMPAMARFGLLTALVVTYALLVAFFVLPAFLIGYNNWRKAFLRKNRSES
ncbi:MAG: MMPL family transporter [Candidatus Hadarchaeales archaeon]